MAHNSICISVTGKSKKQKMENDIPHSVITLLLSKKNLSPSMKMCCITTAPSSPPVASRTHTSHSAPKNPLHLRILRLQNNPPPIAKTLPMRRTGILVLIRRQVPHKTNPTIHDHRDNRRIISLITRLGTITCVSESQDSG